MGLTYDDDTLSSGSNDGSDDGSATGAESGPRALRLLPSDDVDDDGVWPPGPGSEKGERRELKTRGTLADGNSN